MADIRFPAGYLPGAGKVNNSAPYKGSVKNIGASGDFAAILRQQIDNNTKLQFSKHAQERINQRSIDMTPNLLVQLNDAVSKARDKGARDIVVIGGQAAFIVSVPNNTVITTIAGNEIKGSVFTNIDGAVII